MEVTMRKMKRSDIDTLNDIFNQQINNPGTHLELSPWNRDDRMVWLEEHSNRNPVYVGEANGKVVCWMSINPYSSEYYYAGVGRLEIHIDKKIATFTMYQSLLKFAENQSRKLGYHKLMIRIIEKNRTLLHQYRNMGFRDVGTLRNHGFYQGKLVNMVLLERLLPVDMKKITQSYRERYPFYDEYFLAKEKEYEAQMVRNGMMHNPSDQTQWISVPSNTQTPWHEDTVRKVSDTQSLEVLDFDKIPKEEE